MTRPVMARNAIGAILTAIAAAVHPLHAQGADAVAACATAPTPVVGRTARGTAFDVVGCGPSMLLVHGFSADRRMWQVLAEDWSRRFRLVRVDLKSHGASATVATTDDPVAELLAVLDAARISRAIVVGHSVGAALGVDLAARVPERVEALVLLSPSLTGYQPVAPISLGTVAARARAGDLRGAAAAWLETPIMHTSLRGEAFARFEQMVLENSRVWDPSARRPVSPTEPIAQRLAAIRAPMLIAVGAADASGAREVADLLVSTPAIHARHIVPAGGHWFPLESPDSVRVWVDAFLCSSLSPSPSCR